MKFPALTGVLLLVGLLATTIPIIFIVPVIRRQNDYLPAEFTYRHIVLGTKYQSQYQCQQCKQFEKGKYPACYQLVDYFSGLIPDDCINNKGDCPLDQICAGPTCCVESYTSCNDVGGIQNCGEFCSLEAEVSSCEVKTVMVYVAKVTQTFLDHNLYFEVIFATQPESENYLLLHLDKVVTRYYNKSNYQDVIDDISINGAEIFAMVVSCLGLILLLTGVVLLLIPAECGSSTIKR